MKTFLAPILAVAMAVSAQAHSPQVASQNAKNAEVLLSKYPPRALAAGEQGAVFFKVKLDRDGHPLSCEVTKSSGYPRLDEETCQLITLNAVFKPVRDASGREVSPTHEGVVNWKIPQGATVGAAPVRTANAAPEKKICKRTPRIGTLAGFERTCATKRDWQRASDENKQEWDELQGKKGSTRGN